MTTSSDRYIIGLDFGSESARGVLIDALTGDQHATHVHAYRHGIMDRELPNGTLLPTGWALQDAGDYIEATVAILSSLGRDRHIASIGVDFTASSPMPVDRHGRPVSASRPGDPHAYVKLYKHQAAQPYADAINTRHAHRFDHFGGRISGEWLIVKAAQLFAEAPDIWEGCARFIEAGDWIVWSLTGYEVRSYGFATYKAQYSQAAGYPADIVPGLDDRLAPPSPVGTSAGGLCDDWRARTGILGPAIVAVAVIDSHAALPAVGAVSGGTFVGALGTSAAYLMLSDAVVPLPSGVEGMARDSSIPGLWCYEAGQSSFGDCLGWFVRSFVDESASAEAFDTLTKAAAAIPPQDAQLVALDWWNGNRVPHADATLSGLLLGLTRKTGKPEIYRALMESLCFGARQIMERMLEGGLDIRHVVITSGLAERNPFLLQMMADVLGHQISAPTIRNVTAVGAAIHGAVAGAVVEGFAEGARRYGAQAAKIYEPDADAGRAYTLRYDIYRFLSDNPDLRKAMHLLNRREEE